MTPEQAAKVITAPIVEAVEKARAGERVVLKGRNMGQLNRMMTMIKRLAPEANAGLWSCSFAGGGVVSVVIEGDPYADVDFGGVK